MNVKKQMRQLSRRKLLKFGTGVLGTGALTAGIGSHLVLPERAVAQQDDMTPNQALQRLMQGNRRFVTRQTKNPNRDFKRLTAVAQVQKPFAAILGCADSRVPSEIIFDQGFGDLFICRVAGNVATPEEIGSLEFGGLVLGTKLIMVVGHERCGAVSATIKGDQVPGQIGSLLDAIKPAVERATGKKGDLLENSIKANVLWQVEKLKASPVLAELIEEGKLKIVGGYYDLDSGSITIVS